MPDFIAPQFKQSNIPIYKASQKIKLTKNEVSLQFLMSRDIGKVYQITYLLNIIPNRLERNPSIPLSPANVEMTSLKNAIMANVKAHQTEITLTVISFVWLWFVLTNANTQ